ncbi:hypothetical protein [Ligilactobacillus salivarius]|uniref:hypothetical protein n=1 Tax=Ligilactobacillus salivarius TaxID=1624 RepID=UPI00136CAED5|nr:hypothetical protein [Ligilactobacillus salivarius]MYZ79825.1 hypothetical protein [Ligilactobacillus salivarius]
MTFFEEDPKFYWPDEDKSIFDKNTDNTVNIEWRGNTRIFEDYKELAYDYYQCSCHTFNYIKEDNNTRNLDTCFFVGLFLIRNAFELSIKALILRNYSNSDLKKIIFHDLDELFKIYKDVPRIPLSATEEEWLSKYFNSLSKTDPNSDTFRYAFNQKFIDKYEEEHLNIFKIQSNCFQAWTLLEKCMGDIDNSASFDFSLEPEFLFVNGKWYEDTFIWQPSNSIELDSDHTAKLIGYETMFDILYNHLNKGSYNLFYPFMLIARITLELYIKVFLYDHFITLANQEKLIKKIKTHNLKKLFLLFKEDIIKKNSDYIENTEFHIIEKRIIELHNLDKNAFTFRYLTDKNSTYYLNNTTFDIDNVYKYFKELFAYFDAFNH